MTMKRIISYAGVVLALASCTQNAADKYVVTVNAEPDDEGKMAYMVDFDTDVRMDSALIKGGVASFVGDIDGSRYVSILVDDDKKSLGDFFLQGDSIIVTEGSAEGGELNAKHHNYWDVRLSMIRDFNQLSDSLKAARYDEVSSRIDDLEKNLMEENIDNALGFYYFFYGPCRDMTLAQLDSVISVHPVLGGYKRVQKVRDGLVKYAETSEGAMFKDFEVTYNDSTFRLSDHVGRGHYVLVDFWASWCGPCMRQGEVIKELYKEYAPKGLEVIGVAVWDEPEKTLDAIESHELPWMNVINAQSIPTDIYGIAGIPTIILFGPDGRIVSRDKQNDELREAVRNAMEQ